MVGITPSIYKAKYIPDSNTKVYSDVDLHFIPHPISGDVITLQGVDSIKASIKHIVLYNFYEKPFYFEFGSGVMESLFENITDDVSLSVIQENIKNAIYRHEKRISELAVKVNTYISEPNAVHVTILFVPDGETENQNLNISLKVAR